MPDVFEMDEAETKLLEEQASQDTEDQEAAAQEQQQASEQASEQESEQEAKSEEQEEKKGSHKVPVGALQEERRARQAAQQELTEFREKYGKLEGRLEEIAKRVQPQEQAPNFEEDPAAALKYEQERLARQMAEHDEKIGNYNKQTEVQQQWVQFQNQVSADENAFKRENAHYDAAADYLRETRRAEYRALGAQDPAMIEQWVQSDAVQIAYGAMQQGKSVAQAVWDLASTRGYKPPEANGDNSGDEAAQKLAQVEKGQKASKSLSQAGGNTEISLSLEAVASMTDEEFASIPESKWRELMGG